MIIGRPDENNGRELSEKPVVIFPSSASDVRYRFAFGQGVSVDCGGCKKTSDPLMRATINYHCFYHLHHHRGGFWRRGCVVVWQILKIIITTVMARLLKGEDVPDWWSVSGTYMGIYE